MGSIELAFVIHALTISTEYCTHIYFVTVFTSIYFVTVDEPVWQWDTMRQQLVDYTTMVWAILAIVSVQVVG